MVSFGFKYGIPVDADMVVDMRFLPNPHWDPELRPMTGLDDAGQRLRPRPARGACEFLDRLEALLETVYAGFLARAQALPEPRGRAAPAASTAAWRWRATIGERMTERGVETLVVHRDLGRE